MVALIDVIQNDSRYETCRRDLIDFKASLSTKGRAEIQKQGQTFEAPKLAAILKSKVKGAIASSLEVDDMLKGVSILVAHGRMKCQISVYPKLELDALKANVDPSSADIKFDGKRAGIFRQHGTTSLPGQIKLLEEFRSVEANSAVKTSMPKIEAPRSSGGGRR